MLIVSSADIVDVGQLHQCQVIQPVFAGCGTTCSGPLVVTVHPAQLDGLPVQAQHPVGRFNLAQADALLVGLGYGVGRYQFYAQRL